MSLEQTILPLTENMPARQQQSQREMELPKQQNPFQRLSSTDEEDALLLNYSQCTSKKRKQVSQTASRTKMMRVTQHLETPAVQSWNFHVCMGLKKYEKIAKIGRGSYGEVYKAYERANPHKIVALKKIIVTSENSLREINILKRHNNHDNIMKLIDVIPMRPKDDNNFQTELYLALEFCDHDLAALLHNRNVNFKLGEIKMLLKMMLNALSYIHANNILHRDLKTSNILITRDGILKLADFGLSREIKTGSTDLQRYTNRVVTLWYRSPELLLGEQNYGSEIDMWSAGCVMAEMWLREGYMPGNSEQEQLNLISLYCGSITPAVWPGVEHLGLYTVLKLSQNERRCVKESMLPWIMDLLGCDLLDKLLTLDPKKRIDAAAALNHDFFSEDPLPSSLSRVTSTMTESLFILDDESWTGQISPEW